MRSGDIIFSKPVNRKGYTVVAAQWLKFAPGRWSHAAVCIHGPLVIEAFKPGGIKLNIWHEEAFASQHFTAFRLQQPIESQVLRKTCLYFLDQAYRLRAPDVGNSFCSFLVQQIYKRLGVPPFDKITRPLSPNQLYRRLKRARNWQRVHVPVHSYEDPKVLAQIGGRSWIERELSGLCQIIHDGMLRELRMAEEARTMAALVHEVESSWDALDRLLDADWYPDAKKREFLEAYFADNPRPKEPNFLVYRTYSRDSHDHEQARVETINSYLRESNWQHDGFDAAQLSTFAVGRAQQKFDAFLDVDAKLDAFLFGLFKTTITFCVSDRPESISTEEFDYRANALIALLVEDLRARGVTSNAGLSEIIGELRRDYKLVKNSTCDTKLAKHLANRISVLSFVQQFLSVRKVDVSDNVWIDLAATVMREPAFPQPPKTASDPK
jgi:hypothetical protein